MVWTCWVAMEATTERPKRNGVMRRSRLANPSCLPRALRTSASRTAWNLLAMMVDCWRSIRLSFHASKGFRGLDGSWQKSGTVIEIPATKGTRINVLGLMNRKNDLHPYMFEQSINTSVVVACLNDFCQRIKKKTMVIMDNSSIHRSEEFEEYLAQWKKKGLRIKYLIPYAPELNLIEILWRHIKYLWLPFSAYQCMEALREALEQILKDFGS